LGNLNRFAAPLGQAEVFDFEVGLAIAVFFRAGRGEVCDNFAATGLCGARVGKENFGHSFSCSVLRDWSYATAFFNDAALSAFSQVVLVTSSIFPKWP